MRKNFHILLFLFGLLPLICPGNPEMLSVAQSYIQKFKDDAIKEMQMYNIPASITLAQGMLESGYGTSDLAKYANNHFGIKCHSEWKGPTYIQNDDEKNECFRKYATVLDSYTDHSLFLKSRARYAHLFELNKTDYRGWAKGLKEAGYATDPKYTERLLELIESYELYTFDLSASSLKAATKPTRDSKKESQKKNQITSPKAVFVENQLNTETIAGKGNQKSSHPISTTSETHEILRLGIVKYIIIKPGDTFDRIAKETDKDLWQLYKYNDLSPQDKLVPGQRLYLQPKRKKGDEYFHIVRKGETMKSISQQHGIKLKQLYKKNNMKDWEEPVVGQKMYLRSRKK